MKKNLIPLAAGAVALTTLGSVLFSAGVYVTVPPKPPVTLDTVPDRYTRLVLPGEQADALSQPVVAVPREALDLVYPGRKARAEAAAPPPAATPAEVAKAEASSLKEEEAHREEILQQSTLLQVLIGTSGDANSGDRVSDLFAEDAGGESLERALSRVSGAEVASASAVGVRAASGAVGAADIGDLSAAGVSAVTLGAGPAVAVRGRVELSAAASVSAWSPAANSEAYTDYGINDMTRVDRDRYSTFSIDVDTASYSIARRKLQSGQLPPTASVRVEEFVNYFDYDYEPPAGDVQGDSAPFAVNMEGAPHPFQPSHHLLRFGVQGALPHQVDRTPVHLTFLVDTSGSMSSHDKLGLAQRSLHELVENLSPTDTVALGTYAGSVREVLAPTPISRNRDRIHDAIDALSAGGGTGMSSGVELAYQMASEAMVQGHENRVIVLSDGDANIGRTSHEEILRTIKRYAEEGITLSTIGFGMGNYKDTMMEQLADQGDGNYAYIDSIDEARRVFGEDLEATLRVIARDVKIQVEFNPEAVIAYRLIGYENRDIADRDFRNDAVDAGEIGAGHTVTALYDVVLADGYRGEDLGVVRLRHKTPYATRPGRDSAAVEWETRFPARLVRREYAAASHDFRLAVAAGFFAELLRGSPYTAEVTFDSLLPLARAAARADRGDEQELVALIERASALSGGRIAAAPAPRQVASEQVQQIVQRYSGQVKYCYEARLKTDPGLAGRVDVGFVVSGGRVTSASVLGNTTGDAQLGSCILRKVERWRFPVEVDAEAVFPFVLASG
jgi:Ca-activated chloride channel family protein